MVGPLPDFEASGVKVEHLKKAFIKQGCRIGLTSEVSSLLFAAFPSSSAFPSTHPFNH